MSEQQETVFLVSQIGKAGSETRKRADEICDYVVDPTVRQFGLQVVRSDRDPTPGQVTSQILQSILDSKVIVADLTGRNPNVYYELGFAHSFGIPVVILVDRPDSLSFDTQNERVIEIGDEGKVTVSEAEEAKNKLKNVLEVVLAEGYEPSSLVTQVATAQSIRDLAPENALASEVADVKQGIEEIRAALRKGDTSKEKERLKDLRALAVFVNTLATQGRVTEQEIGDLINSETSLRKL